MQKKIVLIELNEVNFDAVKHYLSEGNYLPGFQKIINQGILITNAEQDYDNLEPWIQWPSVHTGKTFNEHQIFRLGDFVNSFDDQIFEKVEREGFSVGAISPMNASNKLKNPAYFIPDPWTQTSSDNTFLSKIIAEAISQAVNDNSASKLTLRTLLNLALAFIFLVRPTRFIPMFKFAINALGKPWRKALFLDMLLYEFHKTLYRRKKPNFSTLFLNAGAHIQHHYFFNSSFVSSSILKNPSWYLSETEDPFKEMLYVYDEMICDLIEQKNTELIIATGLSQKPYEKLKFYYRLRDHESFLSKLGVEFSSVTPRMTRDFLISFDNEDLAKKAEHKLSNVYVDNKEKLFEIDNRGNDIFVVLAYPYEINKNTMIFYFGKTFSLIDLVVFVAIKNGEHCGKGYAYFSDGLKDFAPRNDSHVSKIHYAILKFFNIN